MRSIRRSVGYTFVQPIWDLTVSMICNPYAGPASRTSNSTTRVFASSMLSILTPFGAAGKEQSRHRGSPLKRRSRISTLDRRESDSLPRRVEAAEQSLLDTENEQAGS